MAPTNASMAKPQLSAADTAEKAMRASLSKDKPPYSFRMGKMRPNMQVPARWKRLQRAVSTSLPSLCNNPLGNPMATLRQYYLHGQKYGIWNPCVSVR
jgi:hypothetical protein